MSDDRSCTTRRDVLKTTGTASVLGSVALAGCSGDGGGGDGGDGSDGSDGSDG
ncbi:twin-arginine translocation signal domain-containing protein, partial [Halorubrum sp. SS5]